MKITPRSLLRGVGALGAGVAICLGVTKATGVDIATKADEPTTTLRPTDSAPKSVAAPPLGPVTLFLDPPVRDVRVRVDGEVVASDSAGRIQFPSRGRSEAEVVFVGYQVSPPVRQVRFSQWSDGSTSQVRTVDISKPLPVIGVEVLHRVVVALSGPTSTSLVRFESSVGPFDLAVGIPTWVPASRADAPGPIVYTYPAPGPEQRFVPTPEARWLVTP